MIVDGLNSTEAVEAGRKGTLEGAGRFNMTPAYARKLKAAETAKINPGKLHDPSEAEAAIRDAKARALALVLRGLERWEREAKTGQLDLTEHGKLMRALREHEPRQGPGRPRNPGNGDNAQSDAPSDAHALLAGLQQLATQGSQGRTEDAADARSNDATNAASLPSEDATLP